MCGSAPAPRPNGHRRTATGTTLVELIVALFLGGMVFLGLGWVYGFAAGLWLQSEAKLRMHADGTYALEEMAAAAGQADNLSIRAESELRLSVPASPLDAETRSEVRVFRRKEDALWMDGKVLVPAPGDSGIGVADFRPVEYTDAATGIRTLSLKVRLFSRGNGNRPSDSMWFETSVHLRNRLTGTVLTGSVGETSF